jgi:4-O-beta-D-mannosyl-D-glucose phosphorylase
MTGDRNDSFDVRLQRLNREQKLLLSKTNVPQSFDNGIYRRWNHPVLTRHRVPLNWRFAFNHELTRSRLRNAGTS